MLSAAQCLITAMEQSIGTGRESVSQSALLGVIITFLMRAYLPRRSISPSAIYRGWDATSPRAPPRSAMKLSRLELPRAFRDGQLRAFAKRIRIRYRAVTQTHKALHGRGGLAWRARPRVSPEARQGDFHEACHGQVRTRRRRPPMHVLRDVTWVNVTHVIDLETRKIQQDVGSVTAALTPVCASRTSL
jgi:hypothetical protein